VKVQQNLNKCLKIKKINYGIACRIGDTIYYNSKLDNYPTLLNAILQHEHNHTSNFSLKDVTLDLVNKEIRDLKKDYYSFILSNPSSWTEFLPCWKYENSLVWNPLISALWLIVGGMLCLIGFLLK